MTMTQKTMRNIRKANTSDTKFLADKAQGFTLIEILVVIGMLTFLFGLTLFMSMETWHGTTFRDERDAFIGIMQKARSQSMNNACLGTCSTSKPHGVHIVTGQYTIFQGWSYVSGDSNNEVTTMSPLVQIKSGSFTDVLFAQLSGDATTSTSGFSNGVAYLVMTDTSGHISTTTVGIFGQITWTN